VNVADAQINQANQCILAGELEDLTGLEHPNRMAGRIKNEEICSQTVAVPGIRSQLP
jgi:hypothetical protein